MRHAGIGRLIAIASAAACASLAAASRGSAFDSGGVWMERTQLAVDDVTQAPVRRVVRIWSPAALAGFDVSWRPDVAPGVTADGAAHGSGKLAWHEAGAAPYDYSAVVATYAGEVRGGRAHGFGSFREQSGLSFEGIWKQGSISGSGILKTPDGKDYDGALEHGRPHGMGREVAPDGTSYVGSFRVGLRDGPGILNRADGTTLLGIWRAGILTDEPPPPADPAPVRLAQAGGAGDATISVYADRARNRSDEAKSMANQGKGVVLYEHESSGGVVRLRPKGFPRDNAVDVLGIWKDNTVIEKDYREIAYGPANVVLDVKNNGNAPLQIVDGYLDVTESVTDLQPYVTLSSDYNPSCSDGKEKLDPKFKFGNIGWGRLEDTRVSYSFARRGVGGGDGGGTFTTNLGTFLDEKEMSVLAGLRDLGVDVRRLQTETFPCQSRAAVPQCLRRLIDQGTLGRLPAASVRKGVGAGIVADVSGDIQYTWTDAKGAKHQRRSPYALEIPLLSFRVPSDVECGAGGPLDVHPRIKLRLDEANYRLPIQYRETLAPGQNKRVTIPVGAEKSSQHRFRAVLRQSDNSTIATGPIDLLYFKPREVVVR